MTLKSECERIAKETGYIFLSKGEFRGCDAVNAKGYYWLFRGKIGENSKPFENLKQVHFYLLAKSPKHYNEFMAKDAAKKPKRFTR